MNPVKKAVNYIADKIDELLTAVFGSAGGFLLTQFPQFLAQYLQRLGGHIDEAAHASRKFNLPELSARVKELKDALNGITGAPPFLKLPKFILHSDWSIASETFKNYTPGMTFDEQGLYYLVAGIIVGIFIYGSVKFLVNKGFNALFVEKEKKGKPAGPPPGGTVLF